MILARGWALNGAALSLLITLPSSGDFPSSPSTSREGIRVYSLSYPRCMAHTISKQPPTSSTAAPTSLRGILGSKYDAANCRGSRTYTVPFPARGLMGNVVPWTTATTKQPLHDLFIFPEATWGDGWRRGGCRAAQAQPFSRAAPCLCALPSRNEGEPMSRAQQHAPATHEGEGGPSGLQLPLAHSSDSGPD